VGGGVPNYTFVSKRENDKNFKKIHVNKTGVGSVNFPLPLTSWPAVLCYAHSRNPADVFTHSSPSAWFLLSPTPPQPPTQWPQPQYSLLQ
jgi:hypothetical protein